MSKCVVDTNYLRSRKLHDFLAKSPTNVAVLTDYSAMEAHPGEATLITIFKSMEIVSEFPHQVIILRNSSFASRLKGSSRGLQRRLTDEKATRGFPKYCSMLKRAKSGDFGLQQELLQQGHISARHLDNIRATAESTNFRERLRAVADLFSANDLGIVRRKEPLSDAMIDKLASVVVRVALDGFADHRISKPPAEELTKTFLYRYALCFCFFSLRWASDGGALSAKAEKLRNDLVDLNFASFASFFDGLLSDDAKAKELYGAAKTYLTNDALEAMVRHRYLDLCKLDAVDNRARPMSQPEKIR